VEIIILLIKISKSGVQKCGHALTLHNQKLGVHKQDL